MTDPLFPSLLVRADGIEAQGAFARSQAQYLRPNPDDVARLRAALTRGQAGVVAHYYMDPELQGVLAACDGVPIGISDSLAMADSAIRMAQEGARTIYVLGVDFMSENVRAMLDAHGHQDVRVYRVDERAIGCSLAAAAEAPAYAAWLAKAAGTPRSLHVVYVNTSLRTKAHAHILVPTITCTSGNVVKTILAAAAVPDSHVWFGPDTYMGRNLAQLLAALADAGDAAVQAIDPRHSAASLRAFLPRFHHFAQGLCVVHHLFGGSVAARVQRDYGDCFVTAHLEVPGPMFALALAAQQQGRGVVGSTSDLLRFVVSKVEMAVARREPARLRFVLGTEAGMVTSLVRAVQAALAVNLRDGGPAIEAEIIFPVADSAIAPQDDPLLPIVPGVLSGEGCGIDGGCATCPYMKMNSLDALLGLLDRVETEGRGALRGFEPEPYRERIDGRSLAELGAISIQHMQDFQRSGALPAALLEDVLARNAPA